MTRAALSIRELQSAEDALAAVSVLVIATSEVGVLETAMRAVLDLPSAEQRSRTISLLARKHPRLPDLPSDLRTRLRESFLDEMLRASAAGRPTYFEALANASALLASWLDDTAKYELARDIHCVCTSWRWA